MSTIEKHHNGKGQDSIAQDWIDWSVKNGLIPYVIPNGLQNVESYIDSLSPDLVALIGEETTQKDERRDLTERKLIDYCSQRRVPLIGVLRGMQEINRYYGGSRVKVAGHQGTEHEVILTTPWQKIYGDNTRVVSDHQYAITEIGIARKFKVAAIDTDGNIEAMVHQDLPFVGIMWHPETQTGNLKDAALFKAIGKGIVLRPDSELTLESILA